ncbi:hypothetical protein A5667_21825 [Mycolicibacterium fortuitum]|nr:hypothetical protein A5667_21825 [Mycolicibacterium fortuitum]
MEVNLLASNPELLDHLDLPALQIFGPEGVGQQLMKRSRAVPVVDEQLGTAMFQQHLPAPSAWHQYVAVRAHTRQCEEPPAAPGMQGTDHSALGTET